MHSFDQIGDKKLKAWGEIRNSMKELPKEQQKEMNRIFAELLQSGSDAAREMLMKKHS